jgi:hypothetical protein
VKTGIAWRWCRPLLWNVRTVREMLDAQAIHAYLELFLYFSR